MAFWGDKPALAERGRTADEQRQAAPNGPSDSAGNISYRIEGKSIRLTDGRNERQAAPGSASKINTAILGKPAAGDLDDDGRPDVALTLFHQTGGTGTFVYAAAAIRRRSGFFGTDALFLGDRVAVDRVSIRSGVVVVDYRDRLPGQPMAAEPSVARSIHCIVQNGELRKLEPPGDKDRLFEGWVTLGHEVRTFRPCGQTEEWWLVSDGEAYDEIVRAHREQTVEREPYAPVFMVLYGHPVEAPRSGFGADFPGGFSVSRPLLVLKRGSCKSGMILVASPAPESTIESPLTVKGWARGSWFFEGDFSMVLADREGNVIGKSYCTATDAWMTRDFVPFEGSLSFEKPETLKRGVLHLQKDNPDGKAEHGDVLKIPVFMH
jgi:hypothetical protein